MRGRVVIGMRGLAIGSDYVEDQTIAGLNRFAACNGAHFRPALSCCNCDSIGYDAVRIWPIGQLDYIGNGERSLRHCMRLTIHENCSDVTPDGRIVPKVR